MDSESADADGEDSIESTETEASDELRIVHVKPPIIVRDFAVEIGLKPFKLISELMEMGIFASMNQTIEESTAHTWQSVMVAVWRFITGGRFTVYEKRR